jgi:hypothetical protein
MCGLPPMYVAHIFSKSSLLLNNGGEKYIALTKVKINPIIAHINEIVIINIVIDIPKI